MRFTKTVGWVVVLLAIGTIESNAWSAENALDARIPPALRPWVPWVLDSEDGKNARCPSLLGASEPACQWPARLSLDLHKRGGTFKHEWTVYRAGLVDLPGDKDHWPRGIKLDGKAVPVVDSDNKPQILMPLGQHVVTGSFLWDSLPESLAVPPETGLVTLSVSGAEIRFPMREADGHVFLGHKPANETVEESPKAEEDTIDIAVYRKLTDANPLVLSTHLVLAVSGKNREVVLARALPEGFAPTGVESRWPVRFDPDGHLRLQVRRGQWTIDVEAHRTSFEGSVTRPVPNGLWKDGDEVWVFEAMPDLRTVNVTGVPTIDSTQTLLPELWKSLPAYAVAPGARMELIEEKRGNSDPVPERLNLERQLWLDLDGKAWSVHDKIVGQLTQASRLEVDQATRLGRLSVDGKDQFLTRLGQAGRVGVEVRGANPAIEADSRIDNANDNANASILSATSFVHDFDNVTTAVQLPLGWDLLHARGADQVSGSWVDRWSLGSLMLLAILVLALGRLYGVLTALVALVLFGLTLTDSGAPAVVWLLVIAAEVAARALAPGQRQQAAQVVRAAVWVLVGLVTVPFLLVQGAFALHPATALDREKAERTVLFSLSDVGALYKKGERPQAATEFGRDAYGVLNEETVGAEFRAKGGEGKMAKKEVRQRLAGRIEGLHGLRGPVDDPSPALASRHKGEPQPVPAARNVPSTPNLGDYDPSLVVQTGEGLPVEAPAWRTVKLSFTGPVKADRQIRLFLLPPWLCRVLAATEVLLAMLLAWLILRRPLRLRETLPRKPLLAGLLTLSLLLPLLVPLSARADDFPSKEMLDELQKRVLAEPDCTPECAAMNDMVVRVRPRGLTITLTISVAKTSAVLLPGDTASWSPTEVLVAGKPATSLARGADGKLRLALGEGVFAVELSGPLPARDSFQIPLPMPPHHASFTATGFDVSGIHEDGIADGSLQLTRVTSNKEDRRENNSAEDEDKNEASQAGPALPPFFRVERSLLLGLKREVRTRVLRTTPTGTPAVIEIPLLPGESVTTPDVRTESAHGTVSLSFGPADTEMVWDSTLAERPAIELRANPANASRWSELWRAEVGPTWHATFSGIPALRQPANTSGRIPEWQPWPGETVRIAVEKPAAAPGQSKTIDAARLTIAPGLRDSHNTLVVDMRSSQSTTHVITLPAAAEDVQIQRDNAEQAIRRQGSDFTLALPAGKHSFQLAWRQPTGLSLLFRAPLVDLHASSVNNVVKLTLTDSKRWIGWLDGPPMGPTVQFWTVLVLLLVASLVAGRSKLTPLRPHHWFLLGLGLVQVHAVFALTVPALLFGLGLRSRHAPDANRPLRYDLAQIGLLVFLVMSLIVLLNVADLGLWRTPDMMIAGTNSTAQHLAWFEDRSGPMVARPTMLSLPLWTFRLCAVAWLLWLGIALIRWSGWAWSAFKQHGIWHSLTRPVNLPPPGPTF